MRVLCDRDDILQAIRLAQNAITSTTLPVLSHILLLAEEDRVNVTATNLETTICSSFEAKIEEEGSICLPGAKLYSILRELPPGQVFIETQDSKGIIKMHQIFFSLLGFAGEEFPQVPSPIETVISVPQLTLQEAIEKTMWAAGQDEVRQNLNCVLFEGVLEGEDGKESPFLRAVATDGRRLSLLLIPDFPVSSPFKVLVPLKSVRQLAKILEKEGDVKIGIEENRVLFQTTKFSFFSQLIDAKFPDYQGVIPKECELSFVVNRENLMAAIRRVSLLSEEQTRLVKFNLKEGVLNINTTSARMGSASERLSVSRIEGRREEIEIGFNAVFLMEALRVIQEEAVQVDLIDHESPCVLYPQGSKNYIYVLMPVKLREET